MRASNGRAAPRYAQDLARKDLVRILEHGPVGLKDLFVAVRAAKAFLGNFGQGVAALDGHHFGGLVDGRGRRGCARSRRTGLHAGCVRYLQLRRRGWGQLQGVVVYFVALSSDFNNLFGLYDWYFVQHFGFFAIVLGFSLVFARRYQENHQRLESALNQLDQHQDVALRTEKLRVLGLISAEIAHEIRNPLTVIIGLSEILRDRLRADGRDAKAFVDLTEKIIWNGHMIEKIIRNLRTLVRGDGNDPLTHEPVHGILMQVAEMLGPRLVRDQVRLEVMSVDPALTVECRSTQILQVLLNQLTNALDAVRGRPEPWVRIEVVTDAKTLDVAVCDSGPGVPVAIRGKIFDTFFTTKAHQNGTGLGLSLSSKILAEHNGRLYLDETSTVTRFVMQLPYRQPD